MSIWRFEDKDNLKTHVNTLAMEVINEITDNPGSTSDYKIAKIMGVRDLLQKVSEYLEADNDTDS